MKVEDSKYSMPFGNTWPFPQQLRFIRTQGSKPGSPSMCPPRRVYEPWLKMVGCDYSSFRGPLHKAKRCGCSEPIHVST